jgi:hypothetical protein
VVAQYRGRARARALSAAGYEVEALTPCFHDVYGPRPEGETASLRTRAMYALGTRGRSAAALARPAR